MWSDANFSICGSLKTPPEKIRFFSIALYVEHETKTNSKNTGMGHSAFFFNPKAVKLSEFELVEEFQINSWSNEE